MKTTWSEPDPGVVAFGKDLGQDGPKLIHDVGCGTGRHTAALQHLGHRVVASDLDMTAVRSVMAHGDHVVIGSMFSAPFKGAAFDGAVAFNVVYHAVPEDVQGAINELRRSLDTGGLLYLTLATTEHGSYGQGTEIREHTFRPPSGVIHHFATRDNAEQMLAHFDIVQWEESHLDYQTRSGQIIDCVHWRIIARK